MSEKKTDELVPVKTPAAVLIKLNIYGSTERFYFTASLISYKFTGDFQVFNVSFLGGLMKFSTNYYKQKN